MNVYSDLRIFWVTDRCSN